MSKEGVAQFLVRVMEDERFRNQLEANPEATLAQFDLTAEEVAAIKSADPSKIQDLGVDERVSKTASTPPSLYTPDASLFTPATSAPANALPWTQITAILQKIFP